MDRFRLTENPVPPSTRHAVEDLLGNDRTAAFVLGRNKYAESVAAAVPVSGFVDDYTSDEEFLGRRILRSADLPPDGLVVSCVVDGRPLTALDRLRSAGVRDPIDYFTLVKLAPGRFRPIEYSAFNRHDIVENASKYEWLHGRLADDRSREVLERVTRFRFDWDLEAMRGFSLQLERQYFEDFVRFGSNEIFVDGGGFDGSTSRAFVSRCPSYDHVYYFEPNPLMKDVSLENLKEVERISCVWKGLFSRRSSLRFNPEDRAASHIAEDGSLEIPVVALDDEVQSRITFLKLDVEGAECEALRGAAGHLRADRPKVAVCVYHDQRDFWRVPEAILGVDEEYDVYLRHYTEGLLETVMYFIPRDR